MSRTPTACADKCQFGRNPNRQMLFATIASKIVLRASEDYLTG